MRYSERGERHMEGWVGCQVDTTCMGMSGRQVGAVYIQAALLPRNAANRTLYFRVEMEWTMQILVGVHR